jgi:hypothetical protein
MIVKSKKIPRIVRDRNRRQYVNKNEKTFASIIRDNPPKGKAKIISHEEMIKDPITGKTQLKTIYEVKKEKNVHIRPDILYIPTKPPEKERRYLRKENPVRNKEIRYPNIDKYGDLSQMKKSRLIDIAKNEYDLTEKLQKEFSKDELIKFMKDRSDGKIKSIHDYLPMKMRLAKIEPIRNKKVKYTVDKSNPLSTELFYGDMSVKGDATKAAFDKMNDLLKSNKKWKNVPLFGTTRPMNEVIYEQFLEGKAPLEQLVSQIILHADLPPNQKLNLMYLDKDQVGEIYKKMYKQSLKPESEKFSKPIRLPEFKMHNTPHLTKAPTFADPLRQTHIVGSNVPFPYVINPLLDYDYDAYYKKAPVAPAPPPPSPVKPSQIKLKVRQNANVP